MALSNIRREPRREITESVIGTLVVLGVIFADYYFGVWWQHYLEINYSHDNPHYWDGFFGVGMIVGAIIMIIAYPVFLMFPHFIGEVVCNFFAKAGLEFRPRKRLQ